MRGETFPKSAPMRVYSLLYENILKPEDKRLQRKITSICDSNFTMGAKSNVITYKGQIFVPESRVNAGAQPAHSSLTGQLDEIMLAQKRFAEDRSHIRQVMSFLIPEESGEGAWRDSLSDLIVEYIPQLKGIPRVDKEAFYIRQHPHRMAQWHKARERLEYYIGNLLVFT